MRIFFVLLALVLQPNPASGFWGIDSLLEADAERCFEAMRLRLQPIFVERLATFSGSSDKARIQREIFHRNIGEGPVDVISDYIPQAEIGENRYIFSIIIWAGFHDPSVGFAMEYCGIVRPQRDGCVIERFEPVIDEPSREEWYRIRRDFRRFCYDEKEQAELDSLYLDPTPAPSRPPI